MGHWTYIALAWCLLNNAVGLEQLHYENQPTWHDSVKTFLDEIEFVEMDFPNQTKETWMQLKSIIAGILEISPPEKPAIITVALPEAMSEISAVCFLNKIATTVNKAVASAHNSWSNLISIVLSPTQLQQRTISETRIILEMFFKWHGRAIIIVDADKVQNEYELRLAHSTLEDNLATDNRAVIFFPLKLHSHQLFKLKKEKPNGILYDILESKWQNFDRQLLSQLSQRLAKNIIFLENGDKCENNPVKEVMSSVMNFMEYEIRLKNDLNRSLEKEDSGSSIEMVRQLIVSKVSRKVEEISNEIITITGKLLEGEQKNQLEQEITHIVFSKHFGTRYSAEKSKTQTIPEGNDNLKCKMAMDMCSKIGDNLEQFKNQFTIFNSTHDKVHSFSKQQSKDCKILHEGYKNFTEKVEKELADMKENINRQSNQEKKQEGTFSDALEWIAVMGKNVKHIYDTINVIIAIPVLRQYLSQLLSYVMYLFT